MNEAAIILAEPSSGRIARQHGRRGADVLLRAAADDHGARPDGMLGSLRALRGQSRRFVEARIRCNADTDWAAGYRRAVLARSALSLLVPTCGRLVLEAPSSELVTLQLQALAETLREPLMGSPIAVTVDIRTTGVWAKLPTDQDSPPTSP